MCLGIETSCDDTAVALVDSSRNVLSSRNISRRRQQLNVGGIVPELSARQHRDYVDRLVDECIQEAELRISDLDAVAVSQEPGMVVCLKVGIDCAIALAKCVCGPTG